MVGGWLDWIEIEIGFETRRRGGCWCGGWVRGVVGTERPMELGGWWCGGWVGGCCVVGGWVELRRMGVWWVGDLVGGS